MAIITRDGEKCLQGLPVLLRRSKRHLAFFGFLDQRVAVVPAFLGRHLRHVIVTKPSGKAVGLCGFILFTSLRLVRVSSPFFDDKSERDRLGFREAISSDSPVR